MNEEGRCYTKLFIGMSLRVGGATGAAVYTREAVGNFRLKAEATDPCSHGSVFNASLFERSPLMSGCNWEFALLASRLAPILLAVLLERHQHGLIRQHP
jgi:hypothetical protein